MSRYIDADALKYYGNHIGDEYEDRFHDLQWAYRSNIDSAPSIDIVRCSECRYWHSGECWGIPYRGDYDTSIDTKADDFCSYGERSEKPNNTKERSE